MFGLRFRGARARMSRYRYLAPNGVAPWPAGRFFWVLERCVGSSLTRTTYETASAASPLGGAAANSTKAHGHKRSPTSLLILQRANVIMGNCTVGQHLCDRTVRSAVSKPARMNPWLWDRSNAPCSRLSILRFATGPKGSMGPFLGGEKINFFSRRPVRLRA